MPPNDKTQRAGGTPVNFPGTGKTGGVGKVTKGNGGSIPSMPTPPTGNTKPKSAGSYKGIPDGG